MGGFRGVGWMCMYVYVVLDGRVGRGWNGRERVVCGSR